MTKDNREYRDMKIAVRQIEEERAEGEPEKMIVQGYATTFEDPYVLYQDDDLVFVEEVARDAFDETDMTDVIMQYDHEGRVFARTRNNTLEVNPNDEGLFISADLGGTVIGRGLYQEIAGGYTDRMSFGFTIAKETRTETEDEDGRYVITRRIDKVGKLYDVSAVSIPANNGTSIGSATARSVRKFVDGEIERIKTERSKREAMELERKRIAAKLKALGGIK